MMLPRLCELVGSFLLHQLSNKYNEKDIGRNNMKISYSCMPKMKSRINIHNKMTKAKPSAQARISNCIKRPKCPLKNQCLSNNVLYKANLTSTSEN